MNAPAPVLHVAWPDDLEQNPELFACVQSATKALEEELGRWKGLVTADWKTIRDRPNRVLLELTLTDRVTGRQVSDLLRTDEIRDEAQLGRRIHELWGRMLRALFDEQLRRLQEFAGQLEGV